MEFPLCVATHERFLFNLKIHQKSNLRLVINIFFLIDRFQID